MSTELPAGMVPLTEAEMMEVGSGWNVLGWLGAAATAGFQAGRWIGCALVCLFGDA